MPAKARDTNIKPQVSGHPDTVIVVADGQGLLVTGYNGQTITITDQKGGRRYITGFSLSPNSEQIAYVVNDGETNNELWITNVKGDNPLELYRVERGHIRSLLWTPDNQTIIVGWRETGTHPSEDLTLLLLNIKNGQVTPLRVHGVDRDFVFNQNGDTLFYGRTFTDRAENGQTVLYRLEVK